MAIVKNTYSEYVKSGVDTSGVLVTQPCELVLIKATSGSGAATWNIYDSNIGAVGEVMWVLDSSQQNPDTDSFSHPLRFLRGIYVLQTQGAGTNSQVFASVLGIKRPI